MMEDRRTASKSVASCASMPEKSAGWFVGSSLAFQLIIKTIQTIAWRESSVIITGETGTGKEMVARQIHEQSSRAGKKEVVLMEQRRN